MSSLLRGWGKDLGLHPIFGGYSTLQAPLTLYPHSALGSTILWSIKVTLVHLFSVSQILLLLLTVLFSFTVAVLWP